ncbi:hypothetical protein ES695_01880 [Candidatus Atribacteria bacterium 1244-E10-H5-B2]|nr:MAG: hypothetical protein ES695_01880 [Candidatus Atribacteria bacterium 1244-E10-H5-B2]
MAIVDKIRPETIEKLRGVIDFYQDKRTGPIARSWPKKPKPPYTALQAEAMAVFGIANDSFHYLTDNIVKAWRATSVGKTASWTDTFRGIIMSYWKKYKVIAPIAIDYQVIETDTEFKVEWDILQRFIAPDIEWEYTKLATTLINKEDILLAPKPIYFTLLLNGETRLVAPYILFDVE